MKMFEYNKKYGMLRLFNTWFQVRTMKYKLFKKLFPKLYFKKLKKIAEFHGIIIVERFDNHE